MRLRDFYCQQNTTKSIVCTYCTIQTKSVIINRVKKIKKKHLLLKKTPYIQGLTVRTPAMTLDDF